MFLLRSEHVKCVVMPVGVKKIDSLIGWLTVNEGVVWLYSEGAAADGDCGRNVTGRRRRRRRRRRWRHIHLHGRPWRHSTASYSHPSAPIDQPGSDTDGGRRQSHVRRRQGLVQALGRVRGRCARLHSRQRTCPGTAWHGHTERRSQHLRQRVRLEAARSVVRSCIDPSPGPQASILQGREGRLRMTLFFVLKSLSLVTEQAPVFIHKMDVFILPLFCNVSIVARSMRRRYLILWLHNEANMKHVFSIRLLHRVNGV